MKLISKMVFTIALAAGLFGCGGGGGGGTGSAATTNADFIGNWSGSANSTTFAYQVAQSGTNLTITRTTPAAAGITYSGTVNGNSAVVSTYGGGALMGTSTWTKTNSTTITVVLNSCTNVPGYICGATVGSTLTLTITPIIYPIATGIRALTVNGLSKNFTVSGSCTGSGTKTAAPATTGAVFEGVTGFSSVSTITATLSAGCNSIAQTSTSYLDTNYIPLGFHSVGVNYGVYLTPPAYPTSVSVGATGIIGTENLYTDSTKSVSNGTVTASYVVTADTTSTAIVNIIAKIYNASATLTATEQDFYRVDASGNLTPLSVDILYTTGGHLVLTYN